MKALHSTIGPDFRGGSRVLKKPRAMRLTVSITKACIRTVHAKPILGRSCWTITGYTIPPVAVPEAPIPMAKERRLLK